MSELFGKNLIFLRERKKLNQAQMPVLTGVSRATWSDYERGKTEPNFNTLLKISEYFGVSTDELLRTNFASSSDNVNLNDAENDTKKSKNVNRNINRNVNLNPKKTGKTPVSLPENPPISDTDTSPGYKKITEGLLTAIKGLEAANTRLIADLNRLEEENQRLKKEVPQIGQKMEDANTKTA